MLRYNATKRNKIYDWESTQATKNPVKLLTDETKRFRIKQEQLRLLLQEPLLLVEVFFRSPRSFPRVFLPSRIALARCNRDFYFTRGIASQLITIIIGFAPGSSWIAESLKALCTMATITNFSNAFLNLLTLDFEKAIYLEILIKINTYEGNETSGKVIMSSKCISLKLFTSMTDCLVMSWKFLFICPLEYI